MRGQAEGADDAGRSFAEAVAVNLAQATEISVLPVPQRQEVHAQTTSQLTRMAERVGASLLVTGSLSRDGRQLHARINLIDARRNRLLWGGEKDSPEGDLAMLASFLATDLKSRLGARERHACEYFRYVSGSPKMAGWPELATTIGALRRHEVEEGLRLTARLVEAYPNEPAARVMRIVALVDACNVYQESRGALDSVLAGIAALERVDPGNPNVAIQRASYLFGDLVPRAVELMNQVLSRDDLTSALRSHALRIRGRALSRVGDDSTALRDLKSAIDYDPANPWNYTYLAGAYESLGRYEESVVARRRAVAIDPDDVVQQTTLAEVLRSAGHTAESMEISARVCENAKFVRACALYARELLDGSRREQALAVARKAEELEGRTLDDYYALARFWAVAGDRTQALRLLREGLDRGMNAAWIPDLRAEKDFAGLRGDPGFKGILRELGQRRI